MLIRHNWLSSSYLCLDKSFICSTSLANNSWISDPRHGHRLHCCMFLVVVVKHEPLLCWGDDVAERFEFSYIGDSGTFVGFTSGWAWILYTALILQFMWCSPIGRQTVCANHSAHSYRVYASSCSSLSALSYSSWCSTITAASRCDDDRALVLNWYYCTEMSHSPRSP